jgi:protocatechuate 3,4-dioxygenase beta subunit
MIVLQREVGGDLQFAGRTPTGADGSYEARWLQAGDYRVTAYATVGRYGQESAERVPIGAGPDATVRDFALGAGAELVVRVVDSAGAPVAGASLTFVDDAGNAVGFGLFEVTDASGVLRVNGVKPGRWTIRASDAQDRRAVVVAVAVADEEREVPITLPEKH